MRLIVGNGVRLMAVGLGLGLLASVASAQYLASRLAGVNASDPLVFLGAALILSVVTLLACSLPARRAAKADPMIALRAE